MDSQPALFSAQMSIISSAIEEERNYSKEAKAKSDELLRRSQANQMPQTPGFAKVPIPKRGG